MPQAPSPQFKRSVTFQKGEERRGEERPPNPHSLEPLTEYLVVRVEIIVHTENDVNCHMNGKKKKIKMTKES